MSILGGTPDFFGLDIGTTAVRVVQLRGKGPQKTVFRYGKTPLDQKLVNKTDSNSLRKLADVIRETLVQAQITTRNVVVGLPSDRVFFTVKKFDNLSVGDIVKTLRFQADLIIPTKREESKIDWAILDSDEKDAASRNVFICSATNKYIQQRLEMLESINLEVLVFEPDILALIRAVTSSGSNEASLIINIGFYSTDITIIYKNQPYLVTNVAVGVYNILKLIINTLGVSQAEAQKHLFQSGFKSNGQPDLLPTAISQALDRLMVQLNKSMSYFINYYPQYTLSQIVLCGDVIYVPGLDQFLQQSLSLPVVNGDAWQNVTYPTSSQDALRQLSVNFMVAAGLAERQVV